MIWRILLFVLGGAALGFGYQRLVVSTAAWFIGFDPDAWAPAQRIRATLTPTLLIHGGADTQVPLRHSQALARAAPGRARLLVLHGATHDSMPTDAKRVVRDEAVAWFDAKLRQARGAPRDCM